MGGRIIPCSYVGAQAGLCMKQPGCGTVLGVFHHGWYLDCGGQVLLLHNTQYGRVPFGIGVDQFEETLAYQKQLEGTSVYWDSRELVISETEERIELSPAEETLWRPFQKSALQWMAPLAENLLEQEGNGYLRELLPYRNTLIEGDVLELTGNLYLTRSADALANFFLALNSGREEGLAAALHKMIGFGPGLTPSLDDWLVGFLYVLLRQQETVLTGQICRLVCELAEKRTNRISAAYLQSAAKHMYFETLQRAGEAQCPSDLRHLMAIGGSSGCDMLTGMLFAIEYL